MCEDKNIPIKCYDLEPIPYVFDGANKLYYPDFIIEESTIVEIKGFFRKKRDQIIEKRKALDEYCKEKNIFHKFITKEQISKKYIDKAIRIHNGIQTK